MELTENEKLYEELVQLAWKDERFKEQLIAKPMEAIEKIAGKKIQLPKGKTIVVNDQTSEDIIHINIPAPPIMDELELSEEQLEAIAGGAFPHSIITMLPDFSKWMPGEDGGPMK